MPETLLTFSPPFCWADIEAAVKESGGVILDGYLSQEELLAVHHDTDSYLADQSESGTARTGSEQYDRFLGARTLRLHGLIEKLPSTAALIGATELISCAERILEPQSTSVRLSAAELIQIQPGEKAQLLHRDSDSWPLPLADAPVIVNAIIALDPFTAENGATHVVPGSHLWRKDRKSNKDEQLQAVMPAGAALLFRGDMLHGGGANDSDRRRRALSISFCAGWLRPVENSFLNLSKETVRALPQQLQDVLGFAAYDGSSRGGGLLGLMENGNPKDAQQDA